MTDEATPAGLSDPVPARGLSGWLGIGVRGMAMGVAELVPGVSGGTIAFVTGIYDELIRTLASFSLVGSPRLLWRDGWRTFWRAHNLTFLLVLASGMVMAVVVFARLLEYLLDQVAVMVWGFFFGLIAASVVQIGRFRPPAALAVYGVVGLLLGAALMQVGFREGEAPLWMFFVGGMLAVSAWLLPAVSGSFLLLVLGLYEPVLRAFNAGHWLVPAVLAAGCAVGLLLFSRLLYWLMRRAREPVLASLTGFMAGSLLRLWPWQAEHALLSPLGYQAATGQPALWLPVILAAALGVVTLWLLSRLE